MDFINKELETLRRRALYREFKTLDGAADRIVTLYGTTFLCFSSNNYLGLANDPRLVAAAKDALDEYGVGAGASRLVSGNQRIHRELERRLAEFKGTEAAIVFPTGYMANVGTITSLVGESDAVIVDRLDHASIIDGARLSRAKLLVYAHCDLGSLEQVLEQARPYRRRLVVTDTLFSMDGDIAPLREIVLLAKRYDAIVMADDAHGTGVLGEHGRGALEHGACEGEVDVVMGTLSKALGALGGFVAGERRLIEYLRNTARSFMYTTALPAAMCAAALAAIEIVEREPERRAALRENVAAFKAGLRAKGYAADHSPSPIVPLVLGEAARALEKARELYANHIFVPAIRPPTVPKGTSRLRVSLMSSHTRDDLERLLSLL
jgi:glycine C-acetyltransferase/8-amino-7-oxononanoate synthase